MPSFDHADLKCSNTTATSDVYPTHLPHLHRSPLSIPTRQYQQLIPMHTHSLHTSRATVCHHGSCLDDVNIMDFYIRGSTVSALCPKCPTRRINLPAGNPPRTLIATHSMPCRRVPACRFLDTVLHSLRPIDCLNMKEAKHAEESHHGNVNIMHFYIRSPKVSALCQECSARQSNLPA
jgi:hypothetical protein